jgi:hypothetical protein
MITNGARFGRLTVVCFAGRDSYGKGMYECRCDCGNVSVVRDYGLKSGRVASCGCGRIKHGHTRKYAHHPLHNAWVVMRNRCENPRRHDFYRYGGRGIRVCERWSSFVDFLADVGERPAKGLSLDRINNDGDYEPGNVRWATAKQQMANRRHPSLWKKRSRRAV